MSGRPPWWKADPERLEREVEAFRELGLDPSTRADGDEYIVRVAVFAVGDEHDVEIVFPKRYPHDSPHVRRRETEDRLERHEGVFGNLCLFEDPEGSRWWPGNLAAPVLIPRIRSLFIDSAAGADAIAAQELPGAEPASAEYVYMPTDVLLTDNAWSLELGARRGNAGIARLGPGSILVTFMTRRGSAPRLVEENRPEIAMLLQGSPDPEVVAWVDIAEAPRGKLVGESLAGVVGDVAPSLSSAADRQDLPYVLVTFTEEGPGRGELRRAWICLHVARDAAGDPVVAGVHRVQHLSKAGRSVRTPSMSSLEDAKVVVLGAGSLGAPVALELAKAGVGRLTIADNDHYDVGNAVRHALPLQLAGLPKVQGVKAAAEANNPFIDIVACNVRLGWDGDDTLVDEILNADLVIDTTGAADAGRIVTSLRLAAGGLLVAGLTNGALGAEILVHRADGPCYTCFKLHQSDGAVPRPPAEPNAAPVTPVGCRVPTFHGSGIDATLHGARVAQVAARLLAAGPHGEWLFNWAVYDLAAETRDAGVVGVHPRCYQAHH